VSQPLLYPIDGHPLPALIEQQRRVWGARDELEGALQYGVGVSSQVHRWFFPSLADHPQPGWAGGSGWGQDIAALECNHFADPQATPQHEHEGNLIARMVDQHPELLNQIVGQIAWEAFAAPWGVTGGLYRIGPVTLLNLIGTEVQEDFQSGDTPLSGSRFPALFEPMVDKGLDIAPCHVAPRLGAEVLELAHITHIMDGS
jgi:hypothetical protein